MHYRVYQKDKNVRFELELKHRKTKLIQDYLFNNQLNAFEDQLVIQYFKYSVKVLCLDYQYTDWVLDFQRRRLDNFTYRSSVTGYLESQGVQNKDEEKRFFHFLQFLTNVVNFVRKNIPVTKSFSISSTCVILRVIRYKYKKAMVVLGARLC